MVLKQRRGNWLAASSSLLGGFLVLASFFLRFSESESLLENRYPGTAYAYLLPVFGSISIFFSLLSSLNVSGNISNSNMLFALLIIAVTLILGIQIPSAFRAIGFWFALTGGTLVLISGFLLQMITVKVQKSPALKGEDS